MTKLYLDIDGVLLSKDGTPAEGLVEFLEFANANKKRIAAEQTDVSLFLPDEHPVSVFMAGSPGAGKTESSKNLIERFSKDHSSVLRIDPDDLRIQLPGYSGTNSSLFQGATSILVERIHDESLKKSQSFIFDGTFSNLKKARENIQRSLKRGRFVQILYVYQEPLQAWRFVKAREKKDGRVIPPTAFVEEYFGARENIAVLKKEFGSEIQIDIIIKNIDGSDYGYHENIGSIDGYIKEGYNRDSLLRAIIDLKI